MIKKMFGSKTQTMCSFPWEYIACMQGSMCHGEGETFRNGYYWGYYEEVNY